jgi:hypothetical protein
MNKSVLWENSTVEKDRIVVRALVRRAVAGDEAHKAYCVEKILDTIQTSEWQLKFPGRRLFVFYAYYAESVRVVEIRSTLYFQFLDALYPYLVSPKKRTERVFARKFSRIFRATYGHEVREETSEAVGLLRNRIMHTGSREGNGFSEADDAKFNALANSYATETDQELTIRQYTNMLAADTNNLASEMVLRVLGLQWDDLIRNGASPSRFPMFCKEEDRFKAAVDPVIF